LVRVHGQTGLRECGSRKCPSSPPAGNSFARKSHQISLASHSRVLLRSLNKQLPNQIKRQWPPDGAGVATELANQSSFDDPADCPTQQQSSGCHLCKSGRRMMPFMPMELTVTITAKQTPQGSFDSPILDLSDGTGRGDRRSEGRLRSVTVIRSTHKSVVKKLNRMRLRDRETKKAFEGAPGRGQRLHFPLCGRRDPMEATESVRLAEGREWTERGEDIRRNKQRPIGLPRPGIAWREQSLEREGSR
jgi:hypothetical protein